MDSKYILLLVSCYLLTNKVNATNGSSAVVELTDSNFKTLVYNSEHIWLVEFLAPWCIHCKRLAPQWEKAASNLEGMVKLGTVDATVHRAIAGEFNIRGYPTIKFFSPGSRSPSDAQVYNGGRTAEDIVSWVLRKSEIEQAHSKDYENRTTDSSTPYEEASQDRNETTSQRPDDLPLTVQPSTYRPIIYPTRERYWTTNNPWNTRTWPSYYTTTTARPVTPRVPEYHINLRECFRAVGRFELLGDGYEEVIEHFHRLRADIYFLAVRSSRCRWPYLYFECLNSSFLASGVAPSLYRMSDAVYRVLTVLQSIFIGLFRCVLKYYY